MLPTLVVNPSSDLAFNRLAVELGRTVADPAGLEAALRGRYPSARVRERSLSDERTLTWYVYRDGRWSRG